MEQYIKKYTSYSILTSLILIILSIFLISNPNQFLNIVMTIFSIILILSGIIQVIGYFRSPAELKAFSIKLILGIIIIVLGIFLLLNSSMVNTIITAIIGGWMVIQSIIKIQIAFNLREYANSNWKAICILSIITLLLGILIIINPFGAIETIGRIAGIMLLVSEIINLIESIFMLRL